MNKDMENQILEIIVNHIDEGVHVIDKKGVTTYYNKNMSKIEGMGRKSVMGKPLLDIFPSLDDESSTLLTVMKTGRSIVDRQQTYLNYKGEKVTTINTTFPLYEDGSVSGAIEVSKNITNIKKLSEEVLELKSELHSKEPKEKKLKKKKYTFDNMVGNSQELKDAIEVAKRGSMSSSSVLIYGETGTGKELFAQSIHYYGKRKTAPFIAQNCAALPESLLEGILFGTTKGSFTGSIDRPGLFEQANGGTLLLDEINSMGMSLQAKLLRVLQEGYIRRVGGLKDIPVDVKIIVTTNEHPTELLKNKTIRKDLFYRLNVIYIEIPNLKDRTGDLKLLCNHFIKKFNKQLNKDVWMISQDLMEMFEVYSWPGNVRELENVIEGAMNYIPEDETVLRKEHFPRYMFEVKASKGRKKIGIEQMAEKSLPDLIEQIEIELIKESMIMCDNNITKASKWLKIKRQTLQHKLKKYDIK